MKKKWKMVLKWLRRVAFVGNRPRPPFELFFIHFGTLQASVYDSGTNSGNVSCILPNRQAPNSMQDTSRELTKIFQETSNSKPSFANNASHFAISETTSARQAFSYKIRGRWCARHMAHRIIYWEEHNFTLQMFERGGGAGPMQSHEHASSRPFSASMFQSKRSS